MRAVLQRVTEASVSVEGEVVGSIGPGWMVLLGVSKEDQEADVEWLVEKVSNLRGFEDDDGRMNCSIAEVGGALLVVSQFTLLGDCRKGRRPSFDQAAPPHLASNYYNEFCQLLRSRGFRVETGRFRAEMAVHLVNNGPVTFLLDSQKRF